VSRIDLTRADTEPLAFGLRLLVPANTGGEDVVSVGEVEVEGTVEKAGQGYLLEGSIRGEAKLRCVRCLGEFPFAVAERFELQLVPFAEVPRFEEHRLGRGELAVRFYTAPALDLAELVGEQVELAVPMKPLCNEDCQGLCPRCGRNLNEGSCTCPKNADQRWAPLLGFRPRK
jgi:uncharacterized protein